jgi:hypothetical protein
VVEPPEARHQRRRIGYVCCSTPPTNEHSARIVKLSGGVYARRVSTVTTTECGRPVAPLREADLFRLWLEQRFPPGALTTVDGAPVRVLYRGRPGGGAGPDFRDARIAIGGAPPRLGDVELHVSAADFQRHGHAADAAYRRVVLHVVFDAAGAVGTMLPGGGVAPVLALRPWAERRAAEIAGWLQRTAPWREPCHAAVARMGEPAVRAVLAEAGAARLRARAERLAAEMAADSSEQVLYRALCGALGLTRNVEPFRALADRVPIADLRTGSRAGAPADAEARCRAWLRDAAGFGALPAALSVLPWRLDGLRPNAHPLKRIDALAALIVRHRDAGLPAAVCAAAAAGSRALLRAVTAPGIGRGRAIEIAINAVVPFLIAAGEGDRALALATSLPPAEPYGRLSVLNTALPLTDALVQQGALGFHADWCRRGGCGVCPLS